MYIQTRGLVLREVDYKEYDKILTVMTEALGKCTVLARRVRKRGSKLAASAQMLVYSDMKLFFYKDRYTLDEADCIAQFRAARSRLSALALASYFSELMEQMPEGRDAKLLSLILNGLYMLDSGKKEESLIKAAYELKLMCLAGYTPRLDGCCRCGRADAARFFFHYAEGGLLCPDCHRGGTDFVPLCPGSLSAMRYIAGDDGTRLFSFALDREGLSRLASAGEGFALSKMERRFPTLKFYRSLDNPPWELCETAHAL